MAVKYSENVAVKDSNSASDSQNSPESSIQKNISYSSKDFFSFAPFALSNPL